MSEIYQKSVYQQIKIEKAADKSGAVGMLHDVLSDLGINSIYPTKQLSGYYANLGKSPYLFISLTPTGRE